MLVENQTIKTLIENAIPKLPYTTPESRKFRRLDKRSQKEDHTINVNLVPVVVTMIVWVIFIGTQEAVFSSSVHVFYIFSILAVAICRIVTYLTILLRPPQEIAPSRPFSELLTSFFIISCSVMFVVSNRDVMLWFERSQFSSIYLLVSTVSFSFIVMIYISFIFALKNWACRREVSKSTTLEN